jgi:hypothetical protein
MNEVKVKVTKEGLLIPRELVEELKDRDEEVEVRKDAGRVVILPTKDPILGLGRSPVRTGVRDGSENHDRHLYGG